MQNHSWDFHIEMWLFCRRDGRRDLSKPPRSHDVKQSEVVSESLDLAEAKGRHPEPGMCWECVECVVSDSWSLNIIEYHWISLNIIGWKYLKTAMARSILSTINSARCWARKQALPRPSATRKKISGSKVQQVQLANGAVSPKWTPCAIHVQHGQIFWDRHLVGINWDR